MSKRRGKEAKDDPRPAKTVGAGAGAGVAPPGGAFLALFSPSNLASWARRSRSLVFNRFCECRFCHAGPAAPSTESPGSPSGSASDLLEKLCETLTCPICLEHYNTGSKQPKAFHAGHTMCAACITKIPEVRRFRWFSRVVSLFWLGIWGEIVDRLQGKRARPSPVRCATRKWPATRSAWTCWSGR